MMRRSVGEFASVISRALIHASKQRSQTWTPALEQTLYRLGCRESLSPTLVARVIDPFLVHHHSLALGFFNWASQQPGFSHDSSTYHSILNSLCITRQFNTLDKLFKQAGKVREAYEVLRDMRRKGAVPDIQSYNLLLEACCREDLLRPAKRLWDEMFTNGCPGNLETYNILIQKCSEESEIEDACRLFHDMIEKGVVPDAITYTSVLKGLCQAKDLKMSLEVFSKCATQDQTLARSVLCTFILSLCKEGYLVAAMELLRDQSTDTAFLDSHLIFLNFLADAEEISLAVEYLKWIQGKSPLMHQALSNEILASISSSSKPDPIFKLFQVMQENRLTCTNELGKEMAYR